MGLALGTAAIVFLGLAIYVLPPTIRRDASRLRDTLRARRLAAPSPLSYDPGRELRAEQRARILLRSCVSEEEWEMYRDLGFMRVWGGSNHPTGATAPPYAYLIYPHKPLLAYLPQTGAILNEYCVTFPDHTRPYGSALLPDSDDVLAKWMALTADERSLIADSNMHLPGRQIDPDRVRRDLSRLSRWERDRIARDLHRDPDRSDPRGGARRDAHDISVSEPDSPPSR